MEKIVCIVILILYWIVMFMMCYIIAFRKKKNTINNVHFYVVRDFDNVLRLYLGKPYRCSGGFYRISEGCFVTRQEYFYQFGLDKKDFENLKSEDEPIEVFVNM